jgi:SAM-dependent methyltransferase
LELPVPRIEPFEKYGDEYDEWFTANKALYDAELKAIRQLMPPSGAEGLEVGVGSGKFAAPLEIRTGVEPSEKMAAKARKLGIDVVPGVAEDLPFSDSRFDFVLMVTTICFVDDLRLSLKEALRVLKISGCIIVGFVDKESELGRQYSEKKNTHKFYRDATFYSVPEVLSCLKEAQFHVADIRQTLVHGEPPQTVLDGFGRGAFVAVKAAKAVPKEQRL